MSEKSIEKAYQIARERYSELGIDTQAAIEAFSKLRISMHCWQGDDVAGYETHDVHSQNVVTGNYPGKARTAEELRADIETALAFSPMKHKVNLHQIYAEPKTKKDRSEYDAGDFQNWMVWAKANNLGLDFNPSYFAHPMMDGDLSLSSPKKQVRDYWIEVGKSARRIAEAMGKATGIVCVNNVWIPDGLKDIPASKLGYRERLKQSLDEVFREKLDKTALCDVVESKLFGIGTESFVVGSHDFYLSYAAKNNIGICLDSGHFHPTEQVSDKLSALALFFDNILLHVSRGIRWDSDHIVVQSDELFDTMREIKRADMFDKTHIGLDYFDASVNRIAAWTIGLRAAGKAILAALLEPTALICNAEQAGDFTTRLALIDESKNLPVNAVWDYVCETKGVGVGSSWLDRVKTYEKNVLSKRS